MVKILNWRENTISRQNTKVRKQLHSTKCASRRENTLSSKRMAFWHKFPRRQMKIIYIFLDERDNTEIVSSLFLLRHFSEVQHIREFFKSVVKDTHHRQWWYAKKKIFSLNAHTHRKFRVLILDFIVIFFLRVYNFPESYVKFNWKLKIILRSDF